MKKFLLSLIAFAALAIPAAAQAGHVGITANFSANRYKYSGIDHSEAGEPTWSATGQLVMSLQFWSFTAQGDHSLVYYGINNNGGSGPGLYWVQVGLQTGYDPWGNQLVSNYPIGAWTNANHPYDGHQPAFGLGDNVRYTPNPGQWRIFRYAEVNNPSTPYTWQAISTFNLSAGQTVRMRHDSAGVFSIIDQNGNTLGIANHVSVPQSSVPGYHIGATEEDYSSDSWLDDNITVLQGFENPTGVFWNGYVGCSGNGWNGDNALDANCRGGASTIGAPLDTWRQTSPNWGQVQNYCQECQTVGPPFLAQRDPSDLPPASDNSTGGTVTPETALPPKPSTFSGAVNPTANGPGTGPSYSPPYVPGTGVRPTH